MHGNDNKAWKCTVVDLVGEGSLLWREAGVQLSL
jgi:hypothetical protein